MSDGDGDSGGGGGGGGGGMRSEWQRRVEGTWYGVPGIYEPDGTWAGTVRAARSIYVGEDGEPILHVDTAVDCTGPMRTRLDVEDVLLRVSDAGESRLYDGIDFYGFGHPHGPQLVGTDYCHPWLLDNEVTVQLFPDGETQGYSTVLYQGPRLVAVITGMYTVAHDYDTNPTTRERIDTFLDAERGRSSLTHYGDPHRDGAFVGTVEVYDGTTRQRIGDAEATFGQRALSTMRAECTVELRGAIDRSLSYLRVRSGNDYFYEGPDVYGNGASFGRALFSTQYVRGEVCRLRAREMMLETPDRMAVSWRFLEGDHPRELVFGVLDWRPA